MDWRSINFDWNHARSFLATATEGSLSGAARVLNMSQPTVGRQVSALEKELNVVLFERVGLGLSLTPTGQNLLNHVEEMAKGAANLSLTASGQSQGLTGKLCISATELYQVFILPPIIAKLRLLAPNLSIELIATDSASDLRTREADIAIRNFQPTQPELIAKQIKQETVRLYASPEYLAQIGNPKTAEALNQAEFINFDETSRFSQGLTQLGINVSEKNMPILSHNFCAHWEMVKQGLGIGVMPKKIGDLEPRVVEVLPHLPNISYPVWLTTHRELKTSKRIRLVFDLLAQELV